MLCQGAPKNMKKVISIILIVIVIGILLWFTVGQSWLNSVTPSYQADMDQIRQENVAEIMDLIKEYDDKTGKFPLQEMAVEKPVMVMIGHSLELEEQYANDPVLKRDALWTHSSDLEQTLSEELGRQITLPRDPQKVATFAPNVYIYFVAGNQVNVITHLYHPVTNAVPYDWNEGGFYSLALGMEN